MTKTVYRCEFCNKVYDDEKNAHICEESHVKSGEVALLAPNVHMEMVGTLGRWPDKIVVLTKDHKAAIYGRTGNYIPTVKMVQYAVGARPACQPKEEADTDKEGSKG